MNFLRKLHYYLFSAFLLISLCSKGQSELNDFVQRAKAMGYSEEEIRDLAKSQGYSGYELKSLQSGFQDPERIQESIDERGRDTIVINQSPLLESETGFEIFGKKSFSFGSKLSFEPNSTLPTPRDYQLGSGDELYIDVYGSSEKYHNVKVSPDGNITLANAGPIAVAGLTVEQAKKIIFARLSRLYPGLSGARPTTFLEVGLGTPKTIQVHVVGEVEVPGTYSLSGLSSAFNAIYAASGPKSTGSFRNIEIFRSNKKIGNIDLYDFLLSGQVVYNTILQNEDVILLKSYGTRVLIEGAVKRPGYYEMLDGETLGTLIQFAGGFAEDAYQGSVGINRYADSVKTLSTVFKMQYDIFDLRAGDIISVNSVLDQYNNRITLKGAINRPGYYAISENTSLENVIERAGGLRGDAVSNKVLVIRTSPDLTTTSITVELGKDKFDLQPEDVISIPSGFDLTEQNFVKITGEVFREGIFRFSKNMKMGDLLVQANGLKNSAANGKIDIYRRIMNQTPTVQNELITVLIDSKLRISGQGDTLSLKPFDHIMVRKNPNFFSQRTVRVFGEISYPGDYLLISTEDRISDLIKRAGKLTEWADVDGAVLIRRTEFFKTERETEDRINDLLELKKTLDPANSKSEKIVLDNLDKEIMSLRSNMEVSDENISAKAKRERLELIKRRNPLLGDLNIDRSEPIAIKLDQVLKQPGSTDDLLIEDGDILIIPKNQQTVRMRGRVLYPTTVKHQPSKNARHFINQSGGFDVRAKKSHTYVVYPNGEVKRTRSLGFIRIYPKVLAGSEVIVPAKPIRIPMRPGEWVSIGTGLATIALVISQINLR